MQELEKILKEIEADFDRRIDTQLKIMAGLGDDVYRYGYGKSLEAYQQGKLLVTDIIRKHMNAGWISVKERLPEWEGRYLVTFRNPRNVGLVGYGTCRRDLFGREIGFGWYDLHEAEYFSRDAVIAWMPLPEPYREEREDCETE